MIEYKERLRFHRFWDTWRANLSVMVEAKGGKLLCPASSDVRFEEVQNGYVVKPKRPICFLPLPHKGTSTGQNHKLIAFIDGSFTFSRLTDNGNKTQLTSVASNVAFFRDRKVTGESKVTLDLIDAYHFDHFSEDPRQSAPHPVFHAQRNIRADDAFPLFTEALGVSHGNNIVIGDLSQVQKNQIFGLKTFRMPTPQVDLFSLSVILAADHLVESCTQDSPTYKTFKNLLQYVSTNQPDLISVKHLQTLRADAADSKERYVWQWYAKH